MQRDDFQRALEYVLRNEGGFVNDPDDPGGATKYGITQATLSRWLGRPASVAEVRDLSRDMAGDIYETFYWLPMGCRKMTSLAVATAVFDQAVLNGITAISTMVQRTLRDTGWPDTAVDGHIGEETLAALAGAEPDLFIEAFRRRLLERIEGIILKRPTSAKYRSGWQNRVEKLRSLVNAEAI